MREHCLRFTSMVDDDWQAYAEFNRNLASDRCEHFITNNNTHYQKALTPNKN
jgi:hypothetical protein